MSEAPQIKGQLPFWLSGPRINKLASASEGFWQTLHSAMAWRSTQHNALECDMNIVDLLAFERNIQRFNGEPESLYRKRVHYAFVNAVDAGSVAGFKRIFERLGIGYVQIRERLPERDWDILAIRLSDQKIWFNNDLLKVLIRDYGRTCRRYEFEAIVFFDAKIKVNVASHGISITAHSAAINATPTLKGTLKISAIMQSADALNPPINVHF